MLRALVLCTLIAATSLAPLSTGSPAFAPCVNGLAARRRPVRLLACAQSREVIREGKVEFDPGDCFYRPHSAVVRDLGVLALRHFCREDSQPPPACWTRCVGRASALSDTSGRAAQRSCSPTMQTTTSWRELRFDPPMPSPRCTCRVPSAFQCLPRCAEKSRRGDRAGPCGAAHGRRNGLPAWSAPQPGVLRPDRYRWLRIWCPAQRRGARRTQGRRAALPVLH